MSLDYHLVNSAAEFFVVGPGGQEIAIGIRTMSEPLDLLACTKAFDEVKRLQKQFADTTPVWIDVRRGVVSDFHIFEECGESPNRIKIDKLIASRMKLSPCEECRED